MAEIKSLEREYVIPLRKACLKAPQYERGRIAIRTIRRFIAKHMKIPERDLTKVKLDVYFNNELWFRGRRKPPAKVKVKAIKENDIVKVNFVEIPERIKFLKAKVEKQHKKPEIKEKKPESKEEPKPEEKPEEKKIEEKEKEKAVAEQRLKETEQQVKAEKHLTKKKETSYHRMALQK